MERRNSEPIVEQNFILQNEKYGCELLDKLNTFRAEATFTDAILCVGHEEFPCHRNVLAVSSPYFRAMFSSDLRESKEVKISFNDISPWTLRRVIDYAYTGRLEITVDNAQEMLAAGNLFQYPAIVDACCEFLSRHLHPSNCLGIEEFAHLHACFKLETEAHQYALENFSGVVQYEEFQELPLERLITYLSSDLIDVRNEETVYDAALFWIKHDLPKREQYLSSVLQHVRLAIVDVQYLETVIEREPLIQNIEVCRTLIADAKKYHETVTDHHGHRRRSMQTETIQPRPSTVAKEVMVLVSGINSYVLNSVEMYEPHKDKWSPLPDLPVSISWFSVSALYNDIYVSGGIKEGHIQANVWKFDSAKRVWTEVMPMLTPRAHHASTVWNDKLYVLGGINLQGKIVEVESIECYDATLDQWTCVGQAPFPRKQSHAVPYNQTLVEVGGTQGNVGVQTIESYLCNENGVRYSGEQFVLPESIQHSQIVELNGILFIVWEDSKKVIALDPKKRTFRRLPDMHYAHIHSGATVLNDKLYITGGLIENKPSRIIECYDTVTGSWTRCKSMWQGRACHGCVTIQMC